MTTPPAPLPCDASSGLPLPSGWPAALPLPAGLVITRTERRSGDRLIVVGRVPGDFRQVVSFFSAALPKAGFPQKDTEVDPGDAESEFAGAAGSGRWKVGNAGDCPGRTDMTLLFAPPG